MQELERQLQQKTAQLAALREIGQAINAAWELEATLELITRQTAQVMGMDSCSIYLLDEAGEYLVLKATTGLAAESVGRARLRLGEGLTGWAAQAGQAVGVADAARDPRFKYLPETGESAFQSLLAVPLVNQGRVIGAVNVQTRSYHEYGADEIELLSLIADLAAGALEKAMLYERMQRQITELSTLAEVSETLTSPLYLDEMLGLIVDMAAQVMRAKVCSLMLLDEERGELVMRATQSLSPAYRDKPPLKVGEGIAGLVVQTGQPIAVENVRHDPRYHYTNIAREEGLCSLLCVPLRVQERVIGVFNCYTGEPHTFTPQEIGLFQTLANQTALAIENARLVVNAAVIREMHHRIKNNLQSVAMLLRVQMSGGREVSAREVLHEAINRIQSIAAVHEILSQKGFRQVDVKDLVTRIAQAVLQNMSRPDQTIAFRVEGVDFPLPSQRATSLALAVNELVQNSVEHAFVGRQEGTITIQLSEEPSHWCIAVRDDGVGIPDRVNRQLGLEIVEMLIVEDLQGEFSVTRQGGTTALLRIPKANEG
ncbi:MAG: GAF domain-containing protein [Anaerolineae bacterium]|nr:GAF domain-containing protein [Anaerolineae bacterium]